LYAPGKFQTFDIFILFAHFEQQLLQSFLLRDSWTLGVLFYSGVKKSLEIILHLVVLYELNQDYHIRRKEVHSTKPQVLEW
jgi:hypothetical protein